MTLQRYSEATAEPNNGLPRADIKVVSSPATASSHQAANLAEGCGEPHGQTQHQEINKLGTSTGQLRSALNSYDRYDQWTGSLTLRMVPDPSMPDYGKASWAAIFGVKCRDVPQLMREGLFWSVDNVLPEEGHMLHSLKPEWEARGFQHGRQWILADKPSDGEVPKWVAFLTVISPSLELVTRFRIQDLSPSKVCNATAWDAANRLIYNYNCRVQGQNYNCIYDDKPLEGWWPWPRKEEGSRVFLPPAPGVSWEDELFPDLALARRRAARSAAGTYAALYGSSLSTARAPSSSGCVIL
jgi:hypothetical protein